MATDSEKHRVAAALRGYARRYEVPTWKALCNIVLGREEGSGDLRKIHMLDRLADLIDPDGSQFRDVTKTVDVDTLMALADKFEQEAKDASNVERRERHYNYEFAAQCAGEACAYSNAARRIREACGVVDRA